MHALATASYDAFERSDFAADEAEVVWLQRRDYVALRFPCTVVGSVLRRIATALAVGVVLNAASAGIAFAPSSSALADVVSAPEEAAGQTVPIVLAAVHEPSDDADHYDDGDEVDDESEALECDESEIAERHRNDVRRLLGAGNRAAVANPNEPIEFGNVKIPRRIVETILRASEVTGVDPVYMMALADKESSFAPQVKASSSSAEGLFQFIVRTWLDVVREFGPKHGLHEEAAAIEIVDGDPKISDEAMRERVLGLRRDPYFSAVMAAELLKKDATSIAQRIGRDLRHTEFYLAHFFGVDAAGKFMKLLDGKPKQSAPRVFPRAAKANKPLFFTRQGKKMKQLSVAEVYDRIDRMIDSRIDRYRSVTNLLSGAASEPSI
jgi:Transglycosylase SLT domain